MLNWFMGKFLGRKADESIAAPEFTAEDAWPHPFGRPDGLPRPDWNGILEWAASDESRYAARFHATLERWMEELGEALGPEYHLYTDGVAYLLGPVERDEAVRLLKLTNRLHREICKALPGVAAEVQSHEAITLILIEDHDDYWRYISHYYEDGVHGASGGLMINDGLAHIVIAQSADGWSEYTLAHELTHFLVVFNDLPAWVNEALALNSESLIYLPSGWERVSDTPEDEWQWDRDSIQDFWNGSSFGSEIQAKQHASYELAGKLLHCASFEYEPFLRFLKESESRDAGERAAREHLGISLAELAEQALGPGDWAPDPVRLM